RCADRVTEDSRQWISGIVESKLAAGATNDFLGGVRVNELEAVAKGVLLANHRMNLRGSTRKREVQLHALTQEGFNCQHGCDPGFANVHSAAFQQTASP
ncbi:MAG: hypothetical protein WBV26_14800, partial [Candidatus Sulfotelmatobacter sp.]